MNDPVKALQEFAATMERLIESDVRRLAPADDPVVTIEWVEGNLTHLAATLVSGRIISGAGPAKLEAIVDAANRIGEA